MQKVVRRKAIVDSLKKFMSNVGDDIRVVRFGCIVKLWIVIKLVVLL